MTKFWVKIHYYLWMVLDFSTKGNVRVTTHKNILSILETAPKQMDGLTETSYANHLFQVCKYGRGLSTEQHNCYKTVLSRILL